MATCQSAGAGAAQVAVGGRGTYVFEHWRSCLVGVSMCWSRVFVHSGTVCGAGIACGAGLRARCCTSHSRRWCHIRGIWSC